MIPEEITKLAEEYAEDATKVMAGDPNLPTSDLNGIKRDVAEYAEEVIRWLLRTHCIVEKSNVEDSEEVTIDGWVARDDEVVIGGSGLYLYPMKPFRKKHWFALPEDTAYNAAMRLDAGIFPNLTFENSPMEVEITIKPKKKQ